MPSYGFSLGTMSRQIRGYLQRISSIDNKKISSDDDDQFFIDLMRYVHSVIVTRNQEFRIFEDFFQGGERQKIYIRKFKDETDEEYFQRLDKSVVSNKCRRSVNKGAQALYGIPPQRRMEDDLAQERMMKCWKFNKVMRGKFHINVARIAGTYGFQIIRNKYVRKNSRLPVSVRAKSEENEVEFIPLQPQLTIPIPSPQDNTRMGALILLTMTNQYNPMIPNSEYPEIATLEYVDDSRWLMWQIESVGQGNEVKGKRIPYQFGPGYTDVNPYGDVNIPFTIYLNPGDSPFVLDGASDLHDIIELQNKLNETMSDDGHVIANHTFPLLLFSGIQVKDDFKRGVADVLSTKNDQAKGQYITWDANLEASANYSDRLERNIREVSGYSPVSDGILDNIGQVRNLKGAMVPDMLTIREKQAFYGEAEEDHSEAVLRMAEWHEGSSYENKSLNIKYSEDYIPVDELTRVESQSIAVKEGLEDLRDIIRLRNPELEEFELEKKIEDIMHVIEMLNKAKSQKDDNGTGLSPERRAINRGE